VALAEALGDAALTWCRSGRPPEEQPYLWTYFWAHAVDGGPAGIDRLRELSQSNPAFLPNLAGALNNLGIRYSELGRREEALLPTEEAVGIYRELSQSNPAFLPDLAMALNNLGAHYSNLGRREEALQPSEEAVGIYRELSQSNPAFLPDLATSLGAYGSVQRQAGELQAARESFQESLAVLLPLLQVYRDAFLPLAQDLAGVYFETLRQLRQEPDPELMAAYAAVFADDQNAVAS
jgi:tetratricopeptide (TPR) repeat protein